MAVGRVQERVTIRTRGEGWLDVERAAVVEFTSEDKDYPVESMFASGARRRKPLHIG
jgi:hypothetical protein